MKRRLFRVVSGLPFCSFEQTRQDVHVLVYVNQIRNFRVVSNFFFGPLPALLLP